MTRYLAVDAQSMDGKVDMPLRSLKHEDYSDLELLMILEDLGDEEGWAATDIIAERLGIDQKIANRAVASRFAWMRRWGWIERNGHRWRNSNAGLDLVNGKVSASATRLLDGLNDSDRVMVARRLTEMAPHAHEAHKMMQREVKRNMGIR